MNPLVLRLIKCGNTRRMITNTVWKVRCASSLCRNYVLSPLRHFQVGLPDFLSLIVIDCNVTAYFTPFYLQYSIRLDFQSS